MFFSADNNEVVEYGYGMSFKNQSGEVFDHSCEGKKITSIATSMNATFFIDSSGDVFHSVISSTPSSTNKQTKSITCMKLNVDTNADNAEGKVIGKFVTVKAGSSHCIGLTGIGISPKLQ